MNKKRKFLIFGTGISLMLMLAVIFKLLSVIFTLSDQYTEKDWLKYQLLTSDIIKNAPHISNNYLIKVWARDGSSPQVEAIEFYGVEDQKTLENYLASVGYSPAIDHLRFPMWISPDGEYTAYVQQHNNKTTLSILDVRSLPPVNTTPFQDNQDE